MKKTLSIVLTVCIMCTFVPILVNAAAIVSSGSCGENVTLTLDSEGTVTISGIGEMTEYDISPVTPSFLWDMSKASPLHGSTKVKSVIVNEGVTTIGKSAFYDCSELEKVTLPSTLKRISHFAFYKCPKLESVVLPEGIEGCGQLALRDVKEIEVPISIEYFGSGMCLTNPLIKYHGSEEQYKKISNSSDYQNVIYNYNSQGTDTAPTQAPTPDGFAVTAGNTNAKAGDTVEIPIIISGNTGFTWMNLGIYYDKDIFTFVSSAQNTAINATYKEYTFDNGVKMTWSNRNYGEGCEDNGTFVTLTFKVSDKAQNGKSYPFDIKYEESYSGAGEGSAVYLTDSQFNNVPLHMTYVDGYVTIGDALPSPTASPATSPSPTPKPVIEHIGAKIETDEISYADDTMTISGLLKANEDVATSRVVVAVYDQTYNLICVKSENVNSGQITEDGGFKAAYSFNTDYTGHRGTVRVMWWDSFDNLHPIAPSQMIRLEGDEESESGEEHDIKFINMTSYLDTSWGDDEYVLKFGFTPDCDIVGVGVCCWDEETGENIEYVDKAYKDCDVKAGQYGSYYGCHGGFYSNASMDNPNASGYTVFGGYELGKTYGWYGYVVDTEGNKYYSDVNTFVFTDDGTRFK